MIAPQNIEKLKGNIAREIDIDQKTLKHVFLNLMKRCRICKANSGGRLQHLLQNIRFYQFLKSFSTVFNIPICGTFETPCI